MPSQATIDSLPAASATRKRRSTFTIPAACRDSVAKRRTTIGGGGACAAAAADAKWAEIMLSHAHAVRGQLSLESGREPDENELVCRMTSKCSLQPSSKQSFVELPCEAVAQVIGSDDLPLDEEVVLGAVRTWFIHDAVDRQGSLKELLPLVRWPLLPPKLQLRLPTEQLILCALNDEAAMHRVTAVLWS